MYIGFKLQAKATIPSDLPLPNSQQYQISSGTNWDANGFSG